MRRPRGQVGTAPAEGGPARRERSDDEDRSDDEGRLAGRPDRERSGEHVPNQAHSGYIPLRPKLVLKLEQLTAITIDDPTRI